MPLGQLAPSATSLRDLYTVPTGKEVVDPTFIVCNRGATATTFRISVAAGGEGDSLKQYLYYDLAIDANDTFGSSLGTRIKSKDVVRVYAGNGNLTFQLFGKEE